MIIYPKRPVAGEVLVRDLESRPNGVRRTRCDLPLSGRWQKHAVTWQKHHSLIMFLEVIE